MNRTVACLAAAVIASIAAPAQSQVTPLREFTGISRPIPIRVVAPAQAANCRLDLYEADSTYARESAPVVPGDADLGALLPDVWTHDPRVAMYVQLFVDDQPLGSPLVVVPLLNPPLAMLWSQEAQRPYYVDPRTRKPSFEPRQGDIVLTKEPAVFSGVRCYVEQHVVFDTTMGEITFRLRPDKAPNTVLNFMDLVQRGFYSDIIFHRVVPKTSSGAPFVIQVGDPTGGGSGGPGYAIAFEQSTLPHDFGVLSMARDADPNTAGSQVFVCLSREGTARLDGKYTSFGQAVTGAPAILGIARVPVKEDRPLDPPILRSARLVPAPPFGKSPQPVTRPAAEAEPQATPR